MFSLMKFNSDQLERRKETQPSILIFYTSSKSVLCGY